MTTLDPNREIYPSAPLKLVTCEVRFSPVELGTEALEGFIASVQHRFPIRGPALPQLILGPAGPSAGPAGARLFDSARRQALTFDAQRVSFETAAYHRFEEMREELSEIFERVEPLGLDIRPTRVGLRYIDEIDENNLPEPGAWTRYIDPALSSPLEHFDEPPEEHQSAALFEGSGGHNIVLRYGLLRQPAVDPTGPLVIQDPPQGRYYLIDIDSAWQGQERADPLTAWVLGKVDDLHAPVRHLFETSITEELRNEVLRRSGNS